MPALCSSNNCNQMTGEIYYITGDPLGWLYPALIIMGICLQLAAIFFKMRILLIAGMIMITGGAFAERDLTIMVGDFLATIGLFLCLSNLD